MEMACNDSRALKNQRWLILYILNTHFTTFEKDDNDNDEPVNI